MRALLEDERAVIVPSSSLSATEVAVEQIKLVAHEVRNALIPVRHDMDALRSDALEPPQRRRVEDAREGVVRVLAFVDEMVQASELVTEPAMSFDLRAAIEEAVSWIDTARRVERTVPPEPVHLLAPRIRLTRAISNVVRNAVQATAEMQPVRLSIGREHGVIRVIVDDGGPGVPNELRATIFLEGVTMRRDGGGSGFGLAFARRVVEAELRGKIWCDDSDLGGARFVIEVPDTSSPSPR